VNRSRVHISGDARTARDVSGAVELAAEMAWGAARLGEPQMLQASVKSADRRDDEAPSAG
ncbi:hypothetical protein, partial [Caulobacter sp.]|uniref:hypothetical protein n=1 Tax=Caulobacter sp. TaxID=78 RepID=UPI003BB06C19